MSVCAKRTSVFLRNSIMFGPHCWPWARVARRRKDKLNVANAHARDDLTRSSSLTRGHAQDKLGSPSLYCVIAVQLDREAELVISITRFLLTCNGVAFQTKANHYFNRAYMRALIPNGLSHTLLSARALIITIRQSAVSALVLLHFHMCNDLSFRDLPAGRRRHHRRRLDRRPVELLLPHLNDDVAVSALARSALLRSLDRCFNKWWRRRW